MSNVCFVHDSRSLIGSKIQFSTGSRERCGITYQIPQSDDPPIIARPSALMFTLFQVEPCVGIPLHLLIGMQFSKSIKKNIY